MSKKYTTNFLEDTNGSTGSANQVLVSTAAGIDWVDGSAIPGVPAGSGTLNTIPLWTPDGDTLGDSHITQNTNDIFIPRYLGHTGDGNNYIGFPANDVFNITTAGIQRFRVNADGNVGIGTTSPSAKLEVDTSLAGEYGTYIHNQSSTGKGLLVKTNNDTSSDPVLWVGRNNQNPSLFVGGGANGGNVGIGETNPSSKLEVRAETATHKLVSLNRAASTTAAMYLGNDSSNNAIISSNYSDLIFGRDQSSTLSEWMRIKRDGNVGIGTTSPSAKLEVGGNVKIGDATTGATFAKSGDVFLITGVDTGGNAFNSIHLKADSLDTGLVIEKDTNNVGIGTTSPSRPLSVQSSATSIIADFKYALAAYSSIDLSNTVGTARISSLNNDLVLSPGTNEKMRITSSGNVGIGTTSPGAKLEVAGVTTSLGFRTDVTNSNFNLISRDSSGNCPLFVQSANSSGNQQIARFSYGSATAGAGTNVLTVAKDNSYFTNTNVGIGTTSPTKPLDVRTDIGVLIKGASGANNAKISLVPASGGRQYDLGNSGSDFRIFDASAGITRMHFDNDGNTGIGTTSPGEKLEVLGNVKAETLIATDLTDGYVPYSKSGTLGLQDSKIYTQGAGIGVGTTTLAAGCHITSLSNISATGYRVSAMQTAPSSRGDTGTLGEIRITADYIYVCYATDSWKRVAIAQW